MGEGEEAQPCAIEISALLHQILCDCFVYKTIQ